MSTAATPKPSLFRKWRAPAIIVAIPVLMILLEKLWDQFEWNPAAYMYVGMAMSYSIVLAPVLLLIWFLFFTGVAPRTKLMVVLLLAVLGVAAFSLIRKVEFNGKMQPIVYFLWNELPEDRLVELKDGPKLSPLDIVVTKADSPTFRGPLSDGTTPVAPGSSDWVKPALEQVWKRPVGGGHAGIGVADRAIYTIEQRGNMEAVVAYDAASGQPCWSHQYQASFTHVEPMGGGGPRTTPVVMDGRVYTLGAQGHLYCLDAASGKVVWQTNILVDADAKNLEWGMSGTPLVIGDKVIVNPGVNADKTSNKAVIAYDRITGKQLWAAGNDQAGYASLMLVKLDGVEQLLLFDAAGLKGLKVSDGKQLWLYPWQTSFDMNCAQPIVFGDDQVFISSEVANGGAMLKVSHTGDQWNVSEVWKNRYLGIKFSNAVLHQDHLYGLANGYLTCVEAKTGERKWKARQSYGNGQVLLAGDVLVITTESGEVALVSATPTKFIEMKKVLVFTGRTWNVPAIARGKLYLRNHQEMSCLKLW